MPRPRTLSDWIWTPDWTSDDKDSVRIVYFRKEIEIESVPSSYMLKITAADRYKLYVNGSFVQAGPQKGTKEYWYLDPGEIAPFLMPGKNAIAVEVLRYPESSQNRNDSISRTECPGLYVFDETEERLCQGREGWKCRKAEHIHLATEGFHPAPIHAAERANGDVAFAGWKNVGYAQHGWVEAEPYGFMDSKKAVSPFQMKDRTIPPMQTSDTRFQEVVCVRHGDAAELVNGWNRLIRNGESLTVAPHTRQVVEISAGEEMCGYPIWQFVSGKGAKITVLWAECYSYPQPPVKTPFGERPGSPIKGDRTDFENGTLTGYRESYIVSGYGTAAEPEVYEPYWFKTFRFAQVEVETGDEELQIRDLSYRQTGYPLEVQTCITSSDETFASVWDISERTLRRCMHETYFDCPFYEQLQYVMDSRAEILFTYTTAADDRLARQCMEAFRCSQQSSGLLKASAPTEGINVIPGFSIYYILMLHDHMMYFGDKVLIREHMACVDGILNFFDRNLTEKGLVGSVGGVLFQHPHWSFVDWTKEWNETIGVPPAALKGDRSLTMESLLYLNGLQRAAELMEYVGRKGIAEEYRIRADKLKTAIQTWCIGDNGLLKDGPLVNEYSTHCQVFAVLTGVVDPKEGRRLLEMVIGNPAFSQCSFAMNFYLFRALEMVNWYEKADSLWDMWRGMVRDHLSTCVEDPANGRSECHAWGSAILYELPAVYLGVRPAAPGFEKITVSPVAGHLSSACGVVITPKGMVHVQWVKDEKSGQIDLTYHLPQ